MIDIKDENTQREIVERAKQILSATIQKYDDENERLWHVCLMAAKIERERDEREV